MLQRQIDQNQRDLENTRRQLDQVRGKVGQLEAKEQTSMGKISAYEDKINLTRRYVRQLQNQAAARIREIAQTAARIQQTTAGIAARKQDLDHRLVSIYKYGRLFPLEALLSTRSLPELYRKTIYLRWIARADKKLADDLGALNSRLGADRARLVAAHAQLEQLRSEQLAQEASLGSARDAETGLLRQVRTQKDSSAALAQQLEESARQLQALITELEAKRSRQPGAGSAFESGRGSLPWPLRGSIIASFGSQVHPKYGTKTNNLGIDIQANPGATVRAVSVGKVAYADHFMGYGNLVILDHGGGFYTLYGNLSEISISVGSVVLIGSQVGLAGDYLHFEVRKDGRPVNPLDWLGK